MNGLSQTDNKIGLGGVLSQNTPIYGQGYDLEISDAYRITMTASSNIDNRVISSDYYSQVYLQQADYQNKVSTVDNATYSRTRIDVGSINIESVGNNGVSSITVHNETQPIGDGSSDNNILVTDVSNKGIVYVGDYTANFTTYSVVTKGYVDSNTTGKYSVTRGFTASITETITHNLGTDEIIVQTYESGVMVIPGTVQINGINAVDITFSSTLASIKIVIIG